MWIVKRSTTTIATLDWIIGEKKGKKKEGKGREGDRVMGILVLWLVLWKSVRFI